MMSMGLLFLFMTMTRSPFRTIFEVYSMSSIPANGLGINLILINPWMALHPPAIFVAYGLMVVGFAAAVVHLSGGEREWESFSRSFSRLAWIFLGVGLVFGCTWSYEAWDAYWTWDPAFTSSLMVWLLFTAYLHASFLYRKKKRYELLAPLLAIYSFILALYSTYIIRGGVIPSIHAFGKNPSAQPLLYIISALVLISTILLYNHLRSTKKLSTVSGKLHVLSSANTFNATIILLTTLTFILFLGLSYPIVLQAFGVRASISTGFYNLWGYPLALLLIIIMGICVLIGVTSKKNITRIALAVLGLSAVILIAEPTDNPYVNLAVPILFFGMICVLYRIRSSLSIKDVRTKIKLNAAHITHLGIVILLIGVLLSTFTVSETVIFQSFGERKMVGGYEIELVDLAYPITPAEGVGMALKKVGMYNIYKNGRLVGTGEATFEYAKDEYITRPFIHRGLLADVQITYQGIGTTTPIFISVANVKIVPGMTILWTGCVLTVVGLIPLLMLERRRFASSVEKG